MYGGRGASLKRLDISPGFSLKIKKLTKENVALFMSMQVCHLMDVTSVTDRRTDRHNDYYNPHAHAG